MIPDGSAWRDADFAPWMISLPAGNFTLGASDDDKFANDTERPAHAVSLDSFSLGRGPVTVAEYRAFSPTHLAGDEGAWPVVNVSWNESLEYCAWLSRETGRHFRLPTEAEWEMACRAGTRTPFSTGHELTIDDANFLYLESGQRVGRGSRTPIGAYSPNAFGFHDLHGNVCEWVADPWRASHAAEPRDQGARVIRGGGWDYLPRLLRSAWRDALPPGARRDNVGFRIATSAAP